MSDRDNAIDARRVSGRHFVDRVPGPNAALIGVAGGRHALDTPVLLVDLPKLDRNIGTMAAFAIRHGVGLRPHVKTHKCVMIAWRQIDAGAIGVSCATLGEAEAMVDAGIPSVLLTTPIVTPGKIARLVALAARAGPDGLLLVADNPDNVDALAHAASSLSHPLAVLVDHAAAYGRTGVADAVAAIALARRIAAHPALRLRGLQAYAGNIQHIVDRHDRASAAASVAATVSDLIAVAADAGVRFDIITGGGTGTSAFDAPGGVFTEIQPGSYVFMDAEYENVLRDDADVSPFFTALRVQASVVSTNAPGRVTVDAGTKSFATDAGLPLAIDGSSHRYGAYGFLGDEHGCVVVGDTPPALGAKIEFVTPHCDPTVNLHDVLHMVDGDTLVDIWPIDARGER